MPSSDREPRLCAAAIFALMMASGFEWDRHRPKRGTIGGSACSSQLHVMGWGYSIGKALM
jgi:hypothetical protein